MKILIYQPRVSYYVGGGEVVPLEQARWFSKFGHDVTILTSSASFIKKSDYYKRFVKENNDIEIIELEVPSEFSYIYETTPGTVWKRWDAESLYFSKLALLNVDLNKYDIVSYHNVIDSLSAPIKKPSILHLHGYPEKMNYICDLLLSKTRPVVAVSHLVGKKWAEMTGYDLIPVVQNGIDISRFYPNETDKKYDLLYIGRIIEIKGIQYIIDALNILKENQQRKPTLAIAGKGDYKESLELQVKELGLEDQISFLGYVPDEDLPSLYNSSLVTVLPSYAREGVLTTMLESSACGIPTITTEGTSMTEFLEDRVNGLTTKPKDAESIASSISKILEDDNLRNSLSENTLKKIKEKWSWDIKIKELEGIYNQVIKDGK